MNKQQIQMKIEMLERELIITKSIPTNCNSCEYFVHAPVCSKWQSPVPNEVRPVGCDDFVYDQIPF